MKKTSKIINFCMVALCAVRAQASTKEEDLARRFAKSVVEAHEKHKFNFWRGTSEQPDGGMVMRFRYDVTGDGKDDLLYKSSILTGDTEGDDWTLYVAEDDGYRKADKIHLNTIHYERVEGGEKILTSTYEKSGFLKITQCRISKTGDTQEEIFTTDDPEEFQKIIAVSDWAEKKYGSKVEMKGRQMTSLQNVILDETPLWMDVPQYSSFFYLHQGLEEADFKALFGRMFSGPSAVAAVKKLEERSNKQAKADNPEPTSSTIAKSDQIHPGKKEAMPPTGANWRIYSLAVIILGAALIFLRRVFRRL